MDKRSQPQWTVSGIINAPVEAVWRVLIDSNPLLSPDDKNVILQEGGPDIFNTSIGKPSKGKIFIEVDKQHHRMSTQGEWWYRGVYSVTPHKQGSLFTYSVYNIAPGIGWWAAQLVQGPQHARTMHAQVQEQLHSISKKLGCTFSLITE